MNNAILFLNSKQVSLHTNCSEAFEALYNLVDAGLDRDLLDVVCNCKECQSDRWEAIGESLVGA